MNHGARAERAQIEAELVEAAIGRLAGELGRLVRRPGLWREAPEGLMVETFGVDLDRYGSTPAGLMEARAEVLSARLAFLRGRWEALHGELQRRRERSALACERRAVEISAADLNRRHETPDERADRWKAHHKAEAARLRAEREDLGTADCGEFW